MANGYKHPYWELWSWAEGRSSAMMNSYRTSSQTFSQNSPCKSFLGASESLAFSKALFWCCVCFSYMKYLIVNLSPCSRLMHSGLLFYWGCFVLESFIPYGWTSQPLPPPTHPASSAMMFICHMQYCGLGDKHN